MEMRPPELVGADGKTPLRRVLVSEIAAPSARAGRSILAGHPADDLTPERLATLLRGAEAGDPEAYLALAEQMEERDLHYLSVVGTRKRQVSQLPVTVEAASDDAADVAKADLIREWLARDTLEAELFDILDAIGKGFSVTEIVWDLRPGRWLPRALKWRDPRFFRFDRETGEQLLLKGGLVDGGLAEMPLPAAKFIAHVHPAKSGLAVRAGFARSVAWAYLFKTFALKDWVSFAEVYGLPFRLGRYEAGAGEEDIRTLMRAVAAIGADAAAVIPKSMEMEFVDGKAQAGTDLYERLCQYLDRQISKAVLGQTATTDADTGGLGSGEEHGKVRADIERADAKLLAATLQRDLVTPIVDLNFGPGGPYPRIRIGRHEDHDIQAMTRALGTLVPLGLKVGMSTVRDRLGFPDPDPDEQLLGAPPGNPAAERFDRSDGPTIPASSAPHFLGGSYPSYSRVSQPRSVAERLVAAIAADLAGQDEVDAAAKALASEAGRTVLAPLIEPMLAALAASGSFAEAAEALEAAAAAMDDGTLGSLLERAVIAARLAGATGNG
ncbi:MAG: DUF935 domain-containing protein [Sphingomonadaceae bacterium]